MSSASLKRACLNALENERIIIGSRWGIDDALVVYYDMQARHQAPIPSYATPMEIYFAISSLINE